MTTKKPFLIRPTALIDTPDGPAIVESVNETPVGFYIKTDRGTYVVGEFEDVVVL